jgi:hypothetical protein
VGTGRARSKGTPAAFEELAACQPRLANVSKNPGYRLEEPLLGVLALPQEGLHHPAVLPEPEPTAWAQAASCPLAVV